MTRLEEVDVEAQREDDYGIDRLDLVYSIRGEAEKIVPFKIPRNETTVTGRHTLYLEDLDVKPGDFISYYVRARDLTRGTRPNEARSDIFFLEVKPSEQEFSLAQSQASAGAVVAADRSTNSSRRRKRSSSRRSSSIDARRLRRARSRIRTFVRSARAESELKTRVEQASSTFREGTMRDPRRRAPQRGGRGAPPAPEPRGLARRCRKRTK